MQPFDGDRSTISQLSISPKPPDWRAPLVEMFVVMEVPCSRSSDAFSSSYDLPPVVRLVVTSKSYAVSRHSSADVLAPLIQTLHILKQNVLVPDGGKTKDARRDGHAYISMFIASYALIRLFGQAKHRMFHAVPVVL
jgi:hypothetical protein